MPTDFEIFKNLFERWKRENFSLSFYFEKIFDRALNKLIENTESDLVDEIQSRKYKALFCLVGYSIENIALMAAFLKPQFLTLAFTESTKHFHRKHYQSVKQQIEKKCKDIKIDDLCVTGDDQVVIEHKISQWIETMGSMPKKALKLEELVIDLTGGTKAISIGAHNAAINFQKIDAIYLNADYDKETRYPVPIPGTERLFRLIKSEVDKNLVFVIMPFAKEFDQIYTWIDETVTNSDLKCIRADKETFTGVVVDRIKENKKKSAIIIADLTNNNANVYYELGMAHSFNKNVILLRQQESKLLFDIQHFRVVSYNKDNETELKKRLTEGIKYFKYRK